MRLVEVMDLGLQFPDATAVMRAGQLKTAGGRRGSAIDEKEIEQRCNSPADENENRPNPFAVADGVNEHPDLKRRDDQPKRIGQQVLPIFEAGEQRCEHDAIFNAKTPRRKETKQERENKDENRPQPFLPPDGVDKHPNLKCGKRQPNRAADQIIPLCKVAQQGGEHAYYF